MFLHIHTYEIKAPYGIKEKFAMNLRVGKAWEMLEGIRERLWREGRERGWSYNHILIKMY